MLDAIIRMSIRNKLVVGIFTFALVIWGIYSLTQLPIDAVPDITNNQVQILTVAPSSSAEDIERLVTFPVEQTMATIPGIDEIRSFSRFGLSVVTIVFDDDIDVYWARQQVNERLAQAKEEIPAGMGTPELAPLTTGLGEIFQYVIHTKPGYEKAYDAMKLRTIQDWIVRRQLLGTKGVADVSSFGGGLKQYEIAINTDKLNNLNLSIAQVFDAVKNNNENTGGAYIDKKPHAYFINAQGLIKSKEDIENIVVRNNPDGLPLLIKHVGVVQLGTATRYGAMTRNDEGEVVGAVVMMLKGANSSQVIKSVKERIEQIEKNLPEGVVIEPFLDRTKLVNGAIETVSKNLMEGALIVIFVLVLMLGNIRAGLVVASVIPLAMLFAVAMMRIFNVSGNLMSLGAIDFGLIVDGSVIIVEATLHHLGLRGKNGPLSQQQMDIAVFESASKIRNSAAFGELIILIVYLPILTLAGVEGKMFKPMAQTVGFAIIGALLLSVTYIPMMSALCLSKNINNEPTFADKVLLKLKVIYTPLIHAVLTKPKLILGVTIISFLGALIIFSNLGGEFIPSLDEGDFAVETRVLTGSSLSETIEAAQKSSRVLLDNFPEVKEVVAKIGSSEIPTDPMPVEACDLMVILKEKDEWTSADSKEELAEKMQLKLEENIIGVSYGFQQPIQMRFNELMSGARQDVVVKIFGEDLDKLSSYAKQMGKIIEKVPGATDVYVEQVSGLPQIMIDYNREKLAQFGLNITDVNRAVRTAFAGEQAGLVFEQEKRFALVVKLEREGRLNIEDVRNLFITAPNGNQIPLSQVAEVALKVGPNQIQRDDAKRRIIVGFNVRNNDVQTVVQQVKDMAERKMKLEPGYHTTYGGTFRNLEEARIRLLIAVPVALLFILILLFFTFNSLVQAMMIFTAIPLSAIGGILALWLRDMPFSISAGVGFIALFGVAVLNGIVLIAEYNHLREEGMAGKELIVTGSLNRLRPILMTALVASLGFLPMALSNGSGAEVQKPLATVVIGGLISSTLLSLFVLPVLYQFLRHKKVNKEVLVSMVLLLIFVGDAHAQQQAQSLSMADAVSLALNNNKIIEIGKTKVNYQKTLKRSASEMPKTDVVLMQGQYNSYEKADQNITLTQNIPFPTLIVAQQGLSKQMVQAAEAELNEAKNQLALDVKVCYLHLQYLLAQQQILMQSDTVYESSARSTAIRYKQGESTLLDQAMAQQRSLEIKNQLARNKSEQDLMMLQLKKLLNIQGEIIFRDKELMPLVTEWLNDSSQIKDNGKLFYMRQQIEVAGKNRKVETNKLYPDIKIGYFNQTLIGSINARDASVAGSGDRFQGVLIGLALPLWITPQLAKIKASSLQQEVAKQQYQQLENETAFEYATAYAEYKRAKSNLNYYLGVALPNATLILKQAQKAYTNGDIDYSQFAKATNESLAIRLNHLLAVKDYNKSIFQLQYLTGKN